MMQYLPRYLWADMSGELPHVPVLSSSRLPQTIRDAIRLVVPADVEIIEVDPLAAGPRAPALVWLEPHLRTGA